MNNNTNSKDELSIQEEKWIHWNKLVAASDERNKTISSNELWKLLEPITRLLSESIRTATLLVSAIANISDAKRLADKYAESLVPNLIKIDVALQLMEQNNLDSKEYALRLKSLLKSIEQLDKKIWSDFRAFMPSLQAKHYGEGEVEKPIGSLSNEIEEIFGSTKDRHWYK